MSIIFLTLIFLLSCELSDLPHKSIFWMPNFGICAGGLSPILDLVPTKIIVALAKTLFMLRLNYLIALSTNSLK